VARIVAAVSFVPVPATIVTRSRDGRSLATSTVSSISRSRSDSLSVGDSPVVPHGTRPSIPARICHRTSRRKAASSTAPFGVNGVTSAVKAPRSRGARIGAWVVSMSCI
jgi:hypothetical protein